MVAIRQAMSAMDATVTIGWVIRRRVSAIIGESVEKSELRVIMAAIGDSLL